MRRLTKNKKYRNEKLKIKTKTRTHRNYILKGGSPPSYSDTVKKYSQLFSRIVSILNASDRFKAIPFMSKFSIERLIELLKKQTVTYVEVYKHRLEDNAIENKRQLDEIILPAIADFIGLVLSNNVTNAIVLSAITVLGHDKNILQPANIFKKMIVIPEAYKGEAYTQILIETDPSEANPSEANPIEKELIEEGIIDEEPIEDTPCKDNTSEEKSKEKTTRRNLILAMAKDKTLIEEFINDLIIFNKGARGNLLSDSEKFKLTMTANAPVDLEGGRKYRTINKLRSFRKKTRRNKKFSLLI
jgi:hypothetical protein